MAPSTPDGVPSQLVAGDSWRWRIPDSGDYLQSEGWTPKVELTGKSVLQIVGVWQTSGVDINTWLFSVTATDSEAIEAGDDYTLSLHWVGSGTYAARDESTEAVSIAVLPNPRGAAAGEFQTHAARTLAIIEAKLEGRLSADLESYQIAGRSINKIPFAELRKLRREYAAEVRQKLTGKLGLAVKTRFTNASV